MSGALVYFWPGAKTLEGLAPRVDERWSSGPLTVRRRVKAATVIVLVASLVVHAGLVATALLRDTPAQPRPQEEIAVEVVPEVPKAAEKLPEPVKKAEAPQAAAPDKPVPPPPPEPKLDAKQDPKLDAKQDPKLDAKPDPKPDPKPIEKAEAPQPEAAAPETKAPELKPSLPPQQAQAETPRPDSEIKALQDELASLRAEHAALADETPADPPPPAPSGASGLGPLADSFQAIALPSQSEAGDLPVGYAAIVFSQLAKAKQIGGEMGVPGTAAVKFDIDATGALVGAELVTSSGIKTLDDEALSIVHKAAPFPPPPPGAQRSFSANVSFVGRAGP